MSRFFQCAQKASPRSICPLGGEHPGGCSLQSLLHLLYFNMAQCRHTTRGGIIGRGVPLIEPTSVGALCREQVRHTLVSSEAHSHLVRRVALRRAGEGHKHMRVDADRRRALARVAAEMGLTLVGPETI